MSEQNLTGYHALVCGASRGIGRACAETMAARGACLTLVARNTDALSDVRNELTAGKGIKHAVLALDLNDTRTLAERLATVARPIHILINNAGGPPGGPLIDADADEFRRGFERLLIAAHLMTQQLVPGMREAGYGRIVNIVSTSVREPIPGLGVSNTIRAACAGWAKTLSRELAPDNITINNVLPGFTATDRLTSLFTARAERSGCSVEEVERDALANVPAGRFAAPEEIAAAVAFLSGPDAGYITGSSLAVDGGRLHGI
ncbi:MAG: SDR family oxidoreductase [Gammaproteobacteria bacterium]